MALGQILLRERQILGGITRIGLTIIVSAVGVKLYPSACSRTARDRVHVGTEDVVAACAVQLIPGQFDLGAADPFRHEGQRSCSGPTVLKGSGHHAASNGYAVVDVILGENAVIPCGALRKGLMLPLIDAKGIHLASLPLQTVL